VSQPAGIHRVRPNHREWTPPQVVCFDTETLPADTPEGELHTLRCWTARLDVRRARSESGLGVSRGYGFTAAELADQVEIWAEGQRCLWLYAHNLSFDLATTRLPAVLHERGWRVTGHAVASDSPWLRMKRGTCVLTFADSWGWLRAPLEHIGADVGYAKPDLPAFDDSDDAWVARCEADTEILALAMTQLMDWWDEQELGTYGVGRRLEYMAAQDNRAVAADCARCRPVRRGPCGDLRWPAGSIRSRRTGRRAVRSTRFPVGLPDHRGTLPVACRATRQLREPAVGFAAGLR